MFDYEALKRAWKWRIPKHFNIGRDCADKFASLKTHSDKIALYYEDDSGEEKRYSFSDLSLLTNRIASALISLGLRKGERIVIRLPNIPEFPMVFLGAIKIGAVPVPTSYMLTRDELRFILEDSGAKAVVTTPELYGAVEENRGATRDFKHVIIVGRNAPPGCESLDRLMASASTHVRCEETLAEDPAYLCYTSGTTGFPKGVLHAQRALIGRDPAALFWQALRPGYTVLHAGKLNWTYTLGTGFLDPWRRGCSAVMWGGEHNPKKFFQLIEKYRVNVFMAVPGVYRQMLRVPRGERGDLSSLSHALSAGEHLSSELFLSFKEELGVLLYDGLGMTEFSYYLSNMPGMPIKPGSPGKPQPGHASTLLDEEGREVGVGEVGVLATPRTDPGIMLGYINGGDSERFQGEWFISGDYFYRDEDGYYFVVGRRDDIINTFGYRVSPFEVERVLSGHPAVAECAATGVDVARDKTIVAAFVVLKESFAPCEGLKRDILSHVAGRLAHYKCPRELYFLDSLPKTPNGKIRRAALREEYSNGF
ncbi:MAG: acyl-CoA synthetase [Candidatus Methanosuratincola sp.]|jgi:acyl-coenzyme A synthetase/AMP-(fatty) acid ligase